MRFERPSNQTVSFGSTFFGNCLDFRSDKTQFALELSQYMYIVTLNGYHQHQRVLALNSIFQFGNYPNITKSFYITDI